MILEPIDYLRHGRPQTTSRRVFFRAVAPVKPIGTRSRFRSRALLPAQGGSSGCPARVAHAPAHVRARLVDADFSLKTIGDFVGHRTPKSTEIYAKVAVESLREVALGDGEEVLV